MVRSSFFFLRLHFSDKFSEFVTDTTNRGIHHDRDNFALDDLQPWCLTEQRHDMIPIDIACTGITVLVIYSVVVMQMAIYYIWKHFFQNVLIP